MTGKLRDGGYITALVRSIHGERILSNAVLLDVLSHELGITQLVFVPQELPTGSMISQLPR